jgi:hypothetical protein
MSTFDVAASLPIHLATRLVLDDIGYSNALPAWFDPISVDYSKKEEALRGKVNGYLGGKQPQEALGIWVPKKSGRIKRWSVPAVNDQILLQACVSSFAEDLDARLGQAVFSYRYNKDPERLVFLEDQISAWTRFQDETKRRCMNADCLLQIDLEDAFGSMDRKQVYSFLGSVAPEAVIHLIRMLVDSCSFDLGLPLVNNTIFFLGNAYLSKVDEIIGRHTKNFIRFVDDYRIFDGSTARLEGLLRDISIDLEKAGFRINSGKLRLGQGQEYLDAVSKLQYGLAELGDYVSPAVVRDLLRAPDIVTLIANSLHNPDKYLNEGFGRFQMATIRKYRFNVDVAEIIKSDYESTLPALLSSDARIPEKFLDCLHAYFSDSKEVWRAVWLLYVAKDFDFNQMSKMNKRTSHEIRTMIDSIVSKPSSDPLLKLWATPRLNFRVDVEQVHDLSYIESGRLLAAA